jgi:2-keto-4-pentenoate hydratase/2-oxohepta-3-ene-1,7-dioic acid hydratase in catechol pathway
VIPVRPSKIVCVGRNYVAHAKELGNEVPALPMLFFKPPSALIGPGEPIVLPPTSRQVEYEAEIGVVIGARLRQAGEAEAERGIGGFVCLNDVTCRDLQKTDGQWGRAKGYDTFCPVGPAVAPGLDWRGLEVIGRVNGEQRQRAPASDMHFQIPMLVSYISGIMTLEPGDLIATGTPAGV